MNRRPSSTVVRTRDNSAQKSASPRNNGNPRGSARGSIRTKPEIDLIDAARKMKKLTIRNLGWTKEEAMKVRGQMATFAADWDDPAMDIYDGA
jgi:hypothetical protein